jgi:hypothetical protein
MQTLPTARFGGRTIIRAKPRTSARSTGPRSGRAAGQTLVPMRADAGRIEEPASGKPRPIESASAQSAGAAQPCCERRREALLRALDRGFRQVLPKELAQHVQRHSRAVDLGEHVARPRADRSPARLESRSRAASRRCIPIPRLRRSPGRSAVNTICTVLAGLEALQPESFAERGRRSLSARPYPVRRSTTIRSTQPLSASSVTRRPRERWRSRSASAASRSAAPVARVMSEPTTRP